MLDASFIRLFRSDHRPLRRTQSASRYTDRSLRKTVVAPESLPGRDSGRQRSRCRDAERYPVCRRKLRIERYKPVNEIVQIMGPAERFAGQNEQSLQKFFRGLLQMEGTCAQSWQTGSRFRHIDIFRHNCEPAPCLPPAFRQNGPIRPVHRPQSRPLRLHTPACRRFWRGVDRRHSAPVSRRPDGQILGETPSRPAG